MMENNDANSTNIYFCYTYDNRKDNNRTTTTHDGVQEPVDRLPSHCGKSTIQSPKVKGPQKHPASSNPG